ncbi:MAG: aminopeptidase P N-terminal domain-containing protein, partial [Mariniphaga sp.]
MFKTDVYSQRREVLCNKMGSGVILLLGNDESPMNYTDNTFHFRQDSSFLYYLGIDFPSIAAIIDVDNQRQIIFGNDYTIDDIVWMGPQPTILERALQSGISEAMPVSGLNGFLKQAGNAGRKIHFLPPYRAENKLKLQSLLNLSPDQIDGLASLALVKGVISQREIKSVEEITEIEKAVDLSVDMHVAAIKMARPGMIEAQIAARVYEVALEQDCNISFPIIATINGQTLHNHSHHNLLKEGDLFLVDAGAESQLHYAGD